MDGNSFGDATFVAFIALGILAVFGTISLTFIVLKMFGAIEWNWWQTTSPLWGGAILIAVAGIFLRAMGVRL